ncbi:hypothetical protein H6P81_003228 [Aristolochia fimbriata]|uniref:Uncharacterized protein n=1 Tax=Aristolochia fimbriata TaxID=158543 RepID=A0AAV7FBZ0_ARIFI|nr:hypothetical protein H6P81_003228 [Aristolochia fimbriata]
MLLSTLSSVRQSNAEHVWGLNVSSLAESSNVQFTKFPDLLYVSLRGVSLHFAVISLGNLTQFFVAPLQQRTIGCSAESSELQCFPPFCGDFTWESYSGEMKMIQLILKIKDFFCSTPTENNWLFCRVIRTPVREQYVVLQSHPNSSKHFLLLHSNREQLVVLQSHSELNSSV